MRAYSITGGVVEDTTLVLLECESDGNGGGDGSASIDLSHHVGLTSNLTVLGDVDLGRVGDGAAAARGRACAAGVLSNAGLNGKKCKLAKG